MFEKRKEFGFDGEEGASWLSILATRCSSGGRNSETALRVEDWLMRARELQRYREFRELFDAT